MADSKPRIERPLSPHLQIFRPLPNMVMSILHRITGAALYVGTLILAAWLIAGATSPDAFATVEWALGSFLGRLVLFGYTWALFHHMIGGVRHLIWDTGHGMGAIGREQLTWLTPIGSVALTLLVWIAAYVIR
ncbi:succinate dehydrogenase, cytochrome b556 subunit [Alsobacter sp. SYSU M60028]|uniref:Succinate dehydrogenase cytochrome b556 subunit n=1 Tax=Alsobacter ponti TaxID=2962936 RepID=A0ABT1LGF2_9HYPH|nr:succinate dehydrogenase, cytochrome b556 subunit [Alsobacter ponti]MCP8940509.1 succinate dehydrogenase, cytochrome b556 subunit [Alsobacter ponti]